MVRRPLLMLFLGITCTSKYNVYCQSVDVTPEPWSSSEPLSPLPSTSGTNIEPQVIPEALPEPEKPVPTPTEQQQPMPFEPHTGSQSEPEPEPENNATQQIIPSTLLTLTPEAEGHILTVAELSPNPKPISNESVPEPVGQAVPESVRQAVPEPAGQAEPVLTTYANFPSAAATPATQTAVAEKSTLIPNRVLPSISKGSTKEDMLATCDAFVDAAAWCQAWKSACLVEAGRVQCKRTCCAKGQTVTG